MTSRAYQGPLIAFEFRHVLDSMLAIAALYASRQPPMQWIPLDGKSMYRLMPESYSRLILIWGKWFQFVIQSMTLLILNETLLIDSRLAMSLPVGNWITSTSRR